MCAGKHDNHGQDGKTLNAARRACVSASCDPAMASILPMAKMGNLARGSANVMRMA